MSSSLAISLSNVGKCYRIFANPQDRLKQMVFGARRRYYLEFWALRNISLSIEQGNSVGIIGKNGSGKSTLLQLITGVVTPTEGRIDVNGRVAALLELGTGFNPEFTGRENIFVNGAILGFSRAEIENRFDEFLAFADIGDFIDQPVKTYSSGMLVRLAFSVAINVDPDVLVVDEALAVGDVKFQAKCFRKFQEFRDRKKTILFVSHATEQIVRHCDHAVLLDAGTLVEYGEPTKVSNDYLRLVFGSNRQQHEQIEKNEARDTSGAVQLTRDITSTESSKESYGKPVTDKFVDFLNTNGAVDKLPFRSGYNRDEYRWGDRAAEITDAFLCGPSMEYRNNFGGGEVVHAYMKVVFHSAIAKPIYGLTLKTPDGIVISGLNSRDQERNGAFLPQKGGDSIVVRFSFTVQLLSGPVLISLGVASEEGADVVPHDRRYDVLEVRVVNSSPAFGLTDLMISFDMISENKQKLAIS